MSALDGEPVPVLDPAVLAVSEIMAPSNEGAAAPVFVVALPRKRVLKEQNTDEVIRRELQPSTPLLQPPPVL